MLSVLKNKEKEAPFQLFFLENGSNQNVEVVDTDEIDFEEVKRHLEEGNSVFITSKREQKQDVNFIDYNPIKEPWYFIHS